MKIMAKSKRYYISQPEKNLIRLMLNNNTRAVATPRISAEILNFESDNEVVVKFNNSGVLKTVKCKVL